MTPPSASFTSVPAPSTLDRPVPTKSLNGNAATPATANHATEALASYKPYLPIQAGKEPIEDYNGNYRFAEIHESYVSRAMTARYFNDMMRTATSDVIVVGAGSAGLTCAYRLAKSRPDLFVTVVEAGVAPGGGAWLGGQLFSAMVVRKPAHRFLDEIGVAYDDEGTYVVIKHAALFTSTILSKLLALPNVKLYNATAAEDLIVKKDPNGVSRVCGIVSNWTQVTLAHGLQSCMDPQTISAPVVVSATGHDGPFGASSVKRLANAGLIQMGEMAPLDQGRSEDLIVNGTDQIFPGIICCGMEISEAKSVPRMGPTFGGMFASGLRAAKLAEELHDRLEIRDNVVVGERVAA